MEHVFDYDFFRGFSVDVDGKKISFVYMNAIKSIRDLDPQEAKNTRQTLKNLFESSDIVVGDLNSTPFAIKSELQLYGLRRNLYSKPTYLFPAHELNSSAKLPCFDNAVWNPERIVKLAYRPLTNLPDSVSENPRNLIPQLGLLSDHIAVEVILALTKIVAHNVADPLLWSQYYPNAGQGFDLTLEAESARQNALYDLVHSYAKSYDLIFLQEVPYRLAGKIKETFQSVRSKNMQSAVELEEPSQLVLIDMR